MHSGQGLDDPSRGLYVVVPIYFLVLFCCALWANYKNRYERHPHPPHQHHHHNSLRRTAASIRNMNGLASATSTSAMAPNIQGNGESSMDSTFSAIYGMQSADTLSSHYLGGRDLGPILTTGTIFASFFSGYTVGRSGKHRQACKQ